MIETKTVMVIEYLEFIWFLTFRHLRFTLLVISLDTYNLTVGRYGHRPSPRYACSRDPFA